MELETYHPEHRRPIRSAKEIAALLRKAFLGVGKSPDTHIYDVNEYSLSFCPRCPENDCVRRSMVAFRKLNELEKRVCIYDLMEEGRHYRFWFMPYYSAGSHEKLVRRVAEKFCREWTNA